MLVGLTAQIHGLMLHGTRISYVADVRVIDPKTVIKRLKRVQPMAS